MLPIEPAPSGSCGLLRSLELVRRAAWNSRNPRRSDVDGSMILFEDVIQVLHGSVPTTMAQCSFLLTVGDRGAVDRRQVGVDHSRLRMGSLAERLAKQSLGSICVTQCRQQEIDRGTRGIDGPVQIAPSTLHRKWSKRQSVVELSPCLSSPNRTCTSQRTRLSVQVLLIAKVTSA